MTKRTAAQLEREIRDVLSRKALTAQVSPPARQTAEALEEAAYAVFERPGGEDLTRAEFREEALGLLRGGANAATVRHLDTLYLRIYGGKLP